jgi:hypothetical protein
MQIVRLGYIERNASLIRQVLNDTVRRCVECAARKGREEDGRRACLFDFRGKGCEVVAVVC